MTWLRLLANIRNSLGEPVDITAEYPRPFLPHPNLSDAINCNIAESEIEGGVYLQNLVQGSQLEIQTQHTSYTLVVCGEGWVLISGHPKYCPEPLLVRILGSNWGGSMLKTAFIGRSMRMEFKHPEYRTPIVTSRITAIREIPGATAACDRTWAADC